MIKQKTSIVIAFEKYKNVIFNADVDLNFWTSFIDAEIATYQKRTNIPDEIYVALFVAYDLDIYTQHGFLKSNPSTRSLYKSDLKQQRVNFFIWIRNLAVLKSYNALEIFLIQAIWINYFSNEKDPISSKKAADNIQSKIKEHLNINGLPTDSRNNRHLMEFLKNKISGYSDYLDSPLNVDLTTTWGNYFEMFSVLRNIIAHQGTVINIDTLNEIKSKAKDIFLRHFEVVKDEFKESHLQPKESNFRDFISIVNTFVLNTVKFAVGESNLIFLNMF